LELEVPEIFNGAVEIKAIARESGSRSKVAVAARQAGVDPVGACVGMRGVRVQSIVNELGGEKIDIIEWSPETTNFIAKSLSPAKVLSVQLEEDPDEGRTASVVVPDDQLSLAIGRAGQNARLAAKLTGWRIDIQGVTEAAAWALQRVNEDPNVLPALGSVAEILPNAAAILRQHEEEGMPYTSEELLALRQVIEEVKGYYVSIRNAERARLMAEETARRAAIKAAEVERKATIEAARAQISDRAYEIPLDEMGLSTRVLGHLERAELATAGDVMERLAEGDEGLLKLDGIGPKSLAKVKQCVEALDLEVGEVPPPEAEVAEEAEAEEAEELLAEPVAEVTVEAEKEEIPEEVVPEVAAEAAGEEVAAEEPVEEAVATVTEEVPAAVPEAVAEPVEEAPGEAVGFVEQEEAAEEEAVVEEAVEAAEQEPVVEETAEPSPDVQPVSAEVEEELEPLFEEEDQDERGRRRGRHLVYNEELGEVVVRRRRKREDGLEEWEEYLR